MYGRLLLIGLISLFHLSWTKTDKISYTQFRDACLTYKTPINLDDYSTIFVMHIGYCTSTNFCNEKMVEYIDEKKAGKTLVIFDMEDEEYKNMLLQIEGIELLYIDRNYLEKNAIFSVYNLHIKKKKVKYLY